MMTMMIIITEAEEISTVTNHLSAYCRLDIGFSPTVTNDNEKAKILLTVHRVSFIRGALIFINMYFVAATVLTIEPDAEFKLNSINISV